MRVIIIGGTGLLGQALSRHLTQHGNTVLTLARQHADINLDISDLASLSKTITRLSPEAVINTAAIVDLNACENNPALAYKVNARPAALLAELSIQQKWRFVHISTDHYFTGDAGRKHDENAPVRLLNEYSRTKYIAEKFALNSENALIVRTNIVGFRGWPERPTFLEWAIKALQNGDIITLFDDYYTSSIDTVTLASLLRQLLVSKTKGIINLGARNPVSKLEFVKLVAQRFSLDDQNTKKGSIRALKYPMRAESLGLNCRKAEELLGEPMPTPDDVVNNLASQYKEQMK